MAGPFVNDELFEIVVKYVERKYKSGLSGVSVIRDKETELRYKDNLKEIHTQWGQPNWKQHNDLIRQATRFDADAGERTIDWPLYRSLLLETCMKTWDVTNNDKPVPCTKEAIAKLDPQIASALVDEFLNRSTVSDAELGN